MLSERTERSTPRTGRDARVLHLAAAAVAELRDALLQRHGWTRLDVALRVDGEARRLCVAGEALLPSVVAALRRALLSGLPRGWALDLHGVRTSRPRGWRALVAPVTPLYAAHPCLVPGTALSSELLPADGPVEVLAAHAGRVLVRGMDGTVGWAEDALGPVVEPPHIEAAQGSAGELVARLRSYLGVPYLLGGTTRRGLDCSGLSQRAFREALGVVLPRHSADQLRWGGPARRACDADRAPWGAGDIVVTWDGHEGRCHVGVIVTPRGEPPAVIHASTSRQRVVEDPLPRFTRAAARVAWVPFAEALERHARSVGAPVLDLGAAPSPPAGAAA